MTARPCVDVNLFVYNAAGTIADTLDSVLTQSWPDLRLTVFDNASTDDTTAIVSRTPDRRLRLIRNRINVGPVLNCQRAFWHGGSDFVMPKTGDDLLAPDFIAEVMETLLHHPETAMCHAAGLVFGDDRSVRSTYPPTHSLNATGPDPVARARHVMSRYTSAPAFWGIYRRAGIERLAPLAYHPGWDHAVLAELALYGEIRAIDAALFWRRNGGANVADLARGCSQFTQRNLPLDDALAHPSRRHGIRPYRTLRRGPDRHDRTPHPHAKRAAHLPRPMAANDAPGSKPVPRRPARSARPPCRRTRRRRVLGRPANRRRTQRPARPRPGG